LLLAAPFFITMAEEVAGGDETPAKLSQHQTKTGAASIGPPGRQIHPALWHKRRVNDARRSVLSQTTHQNKPTCLAVAKEEK
jgi:hypothetical protein